jgi:hypothetical protein
MARDNPIGAARRGPIGGGVLLAIAIAAGGAGPAWADGLPGASCCADLEERVAELEATTVRKGNRRVSLTVSGQVSRQLMYWSDGAQNDLYSVDNGLNTSRFRFTGGAKLTPEYQVGFMFEMDLRIGARSNQVNQIDDDGFSGSGGILGGSAFGDGIGGNGDSVIGIRTANWWVESKKLGRVTLGRLNMATAGISTIDLSNAGVVITSEPGEYQGGFIMRNGLQRLSFNSPSSLGATWATMCGGPSPSTPFPGAAGPYANDCNEHGPLRRDAVRYDSPTFWGFTVSGSYAEQHIYDAALRYSTELYGYRVAAGFGYRVFQDREPDLPFPSTLPIDRFADTDRRQWLTSASIMHLATGLFVSGAFVQYEFHGLNAFERFGNVAGVDGNRPDIPLWWVDGGIQKNWTGWGATTFYGEWGRFDNGNNGLFANTAFPGLGPSSTGTFGSNVLVLDSSVQWWGAGVVQTVDAAAMDFYIAYRQYQARASMFGGPENQIPGGLNEIWFIQAGARIQF